MFYWKILYQFDIINFKGMFHKIYFYAGKFEAEFLRNIFDNIYRRDRSGDFKMSDQNYQDYQDYKKVEFLLFFFILSIFYTIIIV